MVYIPKKAAFILMIVLGTICMVDGFFSKMDLKEALIGVAVTIYGIVSLHVYLKKKRAEPDTKNPVPGRQNTK